ncbi:RND family efflux transporter, MFP subunit [Tenacibaculum mesophilum]|uniref:Efflux RND transporter periplasmic adaptor subunit n=1 Tax=Tenacibaculum mesophilum TaxID=104268 RepID=A0ABM7CIX6_9FLAO|nr:efflux RND transporter periplasmic adaptor subunit [Tenacibaculum mesophilum]AZJ33767.1 efflux RND transporter periplasmic adaptor subunit [Tenacibaculum mesophilum]QFS29010.1 efflux RND transporter periplasmic adaptor subunit [Tenacibaculum mesophilum]SHF54054.1 RND family efflux transporter, MFP subunit [Tenacibaculum mesophilum]
MKKKNTSQKNKVLTYTIIGLFIVIVSSYAFSSSEVKKTELVSQKLPVKVTTPIYRTITEWDEYTGRFEASNKVEVRARVSGFLERVNFKAGQIVKKGQTLFIIDDRPFKIALNKANANLAQAKANLEIAQDNFKRVEDLKETGAVSIEEFNRRKQALEYAKASIQVSETHVADAKLNLEFTRVKAPISGLVSRDRVNEGNLIDGGSSNSTLLTTIVATSPIHFYFTSSESDYLRYVRLANNGERKAVRTDGLPVHIKLQDEDEFLHEAKIDFVDNQIDNSTGTIENRAILPNKDLLLEPGMFGKARISESTAHKAIMIPEDIIGTNQSLRYVYVLGENNIVTSKNIILGPLHSNGFRIVREGLLETDKLIINNIQKIRPGTVVTPVETNLEIPKS